LNAPASSSPFPCCSPTCGEGELGVQWEYNQKEVAHGEN
jgi:hypothetical protein